MAQNEFAEALDALREMVVQHCPDPAQSGSVFSGGISANADAIRVLSKYGYASITREFGRMVTANIREDQHG